MEMRRQILRTGKGICGIVGVITLITGFSINPGPPAGTSATQAIAFFMQHRDAVLLGGWMQEIGAFLCIAFLVALTVLAGWASRISGLLLLLGGSILILVSLIEVTFYLLTVQGSTSGNATEVMLGLELTKAIQHGYSMLAAPAVFFPVGALILGSRVVPRGFGYLAFLLGAIFTALGGVVLFNDSLQVLVNILSGIQAF